jgi:glycosyltransferase involved in cell wall biosynthesis
MMEKKIIFTGWREDIAWTMAAMDIVVLPSLNEAVGMVLIQAQALGIPVIATRVGGIPEVVKNNQTGILVASRDSDALAEAIHKLLSDKSLRDTMGEAGKNWIKGRFQARTMVSETSNLYLHLL